MNPTAVRRSPFLPDQESALLTDSNTSRAVLVVAMVGVVRILQAERYYRRKLPLQAAEMHQGWLSEIASDEKLQAVWAPPGDKLSSDDYTMLVHCDRQVSLLSAKFRAGMLGRHTLRVQARWLMEREVGRVYWRESGAFREQEARDRTDRVFNQILADEYMAFSDANTVAP
ncbi:DUF6082 family protein [Streptomyces flaveolus]|uniref:DUF6082 family protein n=1 Tax=Streptomyces flaveolus TaxID=67297 RepID=UPI0036F9560F